MAKSAPAIGPILVGYDASDDGVRALEYAATLAAATKATLRLVYVADDTVLNSAWAVVFDGSDLRATARRLLAEAVVTARSLGVAKKRVLTKVAFGSPVGVLTQLSQDCSMVVVGRRAHSGHARDFPGSTSVGLAGSVHCPLVVVSATAETDAEGPVGVAVEAGGVGVAGLEWVLDNPLFAGQPIRVLSVCKAPQGRLFHPHLSQEQIDAAVAETTKAQQALIAGVRARHPEAQITAEVAYGSPVDELAAFSERISVLVLEAIVRFPTYSVGTVARGLLSYAHCPVVLVK